MLGAFVVASGDMVDDSYDPLCRAVEGSVPDFNDSHTHAEVMAAFDRAIVLAEAEQ